MNRKVSQWLLMSMALEPMLNILDDPRMSLSSIDIDDKISLSPLKIAKRDLSREWNKPISELKKCK